MKRDMDLVRKLVFALQDHPHGFAGGWNAVDGYTQEQIGHHFYLMLQAGLIEGSDLTTTGCGSPIAVPYALTWAGQEFADNARNDTIWEKAKTQITHKVGTAGFGLLSEYLKHLAMEAIGLTPN